MSDDPSFRDILLSLHSSLKLQAALIAKSEQREANIQSSFDQQMASLHEGVELANKRINEIVNSATARLGEEANNVLRPLTSQYGRDVSTMSTQLRRANRIAWLWACAAGSLSLLLALAGWISLTRYQREIAMARSELDRYDAAIPVLQAYYASDATLCGDRICVHVDPKGLRRGERGEYRQARPRVRR
jgi:HAMP domain-containing protein